MLSYAKFLEIMQQTMATTTHWGAKLKTGLDASVGFDSIQEQLRLKALKRGFEFNIMVVGMAFETWIIFTFSLSINHVIIKFDQKALISNPWRVKIEVFDDIISLF